MNLVDLLIRERQAEEMKKKRVREIIKAYGIDGAGYIAQYALAGFIQTQTGKQLTDINKIAEYIRSQAKKSMN